MYFLVSDSPEEILEIVKATFKRKRVALGSCHSSPTNTFLPVDNPMPAASKSGGDVISISDDESSPAKVITFSVI
jgi:hypothetical protein